MPPKGNKSDRNAARTARLEEQLRANLARRKQRARAQAARTESDSPEQTEPVKSSNTRANTEKL